MGCNREFMALCDKPVQVSREGDTGPYAGYDLPGLGRQYFSGEVFDHPEGYAPQKHSMMINGVSMPDTFSK